MVSAVNQTGFSHIPCLAHSLQLSILHGFKAEDTEVLFVKCRKLIGHFKYSPLTQLNCKIVVIHHYVSYSKMFQQDGIAFLRCCRVQSLLRAREASTLYISTDGKHHKGPKLFDSD